MNQYQQRPQTRRPVAQHGRQSNAQYRQQVRQQHYGTTRGSGGGGLPQRGRTGKFNLILLAIVILIILFLVGSCASNCGKDQTSDLSKGVTVEELKEAMKNGLEWDGSKVTYPENPEIAIDGGTVTVAVADEIFTSRGFVDETGEKALALAKTCFADSKVDRVIYDVNAYTTSGDLANAIDIEYTRECDLANLEKNGSYLDGAYQIASVYRIAESIYNDLDNPAFPQSKVGMPDAGNGSDYAKTDATQSYVRDGEECMGYYAAISQDATDDQLKQAFADITAGDGYYLHTVYFCSDVSKADGTGFDVAMVEEEAEGAEPVVTRAV